MNRDAAFLRFLIIGGINTILTYAIFVLLGLVIPPPLAFTISFSIGLVIVLFGSSRWVFRAGNAWRPVVRFGLVYVVLFLIGQAVVVAISPKGLLGLLITSAAIAALSLPLSFLAGRHIFRRPDDHLRETGRIAE